MTRRERLLPLKSRMSRILALLLVATLMFGCSEDDPSEPPVTNDTPTHVVDANGNNLILSEAVGTSSDINASIWEITDKSGGGFYFRGYHKGHWVVGALGEKGHIEWSRRTFYRTAAFGLTPNDVPSLAGLMFVAGSNDADDDSWSDTGVFTIFDGNGNVLDELTWDDPDKQIRFDSAIYDGVDNGSLRFLLVGREFGADDIYFPLVATITLSPDTTLHTGDRNRYAGLPNVRFWEVMKNPDPTNDGYVLTGGRYNSDRSLNHSMVFLTDANRDIQWQHDVTTGPGLTTTLHLGFHNAATADAFYCMGYAEVDRTSSSGAHWEGGMLASFSTQGQVNWIRTYDESQWLDHFYDCQLTGGVLYTAGVYGAYTKDDNIFGYGWLAKIDPQTGDITSSITLGDNRWYSRFNCLYVAGQDTWGAGYTQWRHSSGSYNCWAVDVDTHGKSPYVMNPTTAPERRVENPPVVDPGSRAARGLPGASD